MAELIIVLPIILFTAVVGFLIADLDNDYSKQPTLFMVYDF